MSELVVVAFPDEHKAEEVRLDLLKMDKEHLVDLEDAVIISRNKKGKVKMYHVSHLTASGVVTGGFLGSLLGVIFLNPAFAVLGLAAGSSIGGVAGSMEHIGIKEDFIKEMAEHLQPNVSALCILVRQHPEKVLEELGKFDGKIMRSTLAHDDEEKLLEALEKTKVEMKIT